MIGTTNASTATGHFQEVRGQSMRQTVAKGRFKSHMDLLAEFALLPAACILFLALAMLRRKDDSLGNMGLVGLAAGAVAKSADILPILWSVEPHAGLKPPRSAVAHH